MKDSQSFLWVEHPLGRHIILQLLLSRTNSQQSPLMRELALGEPNESLTFTDKENSNLIHLASRAAVIRYPYISTPTYSGFLHSRVHSLTTREKLTQWSSVFAVTVRQGSLIRRPLRRVLLPLRMSSRGSGWVFMFVLARTFSTYGPGNPKENTTCSQLCTAPLCPTFLTGESENETSTNTPLLGGKYVLATGSFNKTDPAVSWQDTETGRSHRRLSYFRGVTRTFSEVPRWQGFGVFP